MTADDLKVWAKKGVQGELVAIEAHFASVSSKMETALTLAKRYEELVGALNEIDALTVVTVDKAQPPQ